MTPGKLDIHQYEALGCVAAKLGRSQIPAGYAILLNADESHYFWINDAGQEGPIHWNKWSVLKMVKARAALSKKGLL